MKKIILILAVIGVIFIIITIYCCICYRAKSFTGIYHDAELETVDQIRIVGGRTGDIIQSRDKELVAQFVDILNQLIIKKNLDQQHAGGYQYSVSFYAGETRLFYITTYGVGDAVSINGKRYTVKTPEIVEQLIALIALIDKQYQ